MTTAALLTLFAAVAQVAITLYSVFALGLARIAHIQSGALTLGDVALTDTLWPDEIKALQNNVRNQFETPVLLFAGIATAFAVGAANWSVALFAWAYIVSRVVHRMIHVGANRVGKRFQAYAAGLLALAGLWVSIVVGVVFL